MMGKTKTPAETQEFLKGLGLDAGGDKLVAVPQPQVQPPVHQPAKAEGITLAPPGVDPRTMDVKEITFDPRLLDRFPSLEGEGMSAASRYVFELYKSYRKDTPRHSALHRKISTFITTTRVSRKTGGMVTEKVQTTAEQRDLAQVIAAAGLTAEDLAKIVKEKA